MNEASETYPNSRDTWHVALQPLAACGFQCVRPKPDDSHSTVWWNAGTRRFLGRRFEGRQLALDVADLKIVLIEDDDALDGFSVVGLTLDQALEKTTALLQRFKVPIRENTLSRPPYDLPEVPLIGNATFELPPVDDTEFLVDLYGIAERVTAEIAEKFPKASDPKIWPHHFDNATLIAIDDDAHEEESRSVGVGLSPGDASYAVPYLYISPWPYPDGDLPKLPEPFVWHTDGFTAAVAKVSQFANADALVHQVGEATRVVLSATR